MWSLCGLDQKSMRQVVLKSEKLLCCLKNVSFPSLKMRLFLFIVFQFFSSEGIRKIGLRFLANIKMYCPIRRIFILVFSLVYICLLGQYGWALTSTTSQYGFMLANHYNMLWIKLLKHFFFFPCSANSEGGVWVNQNNALKAWIHFKNKWKYLMSEATSACFTTCWLFCRQLDLPINGLRRKGHETLFWEVSIIIQLSKGRHSLFFGFSFWHHT